MSGGPDKPDRPSWSEFVQAIRGVGEQLTKAFAPVAKAIGEYVATLEFVADVFRRLMPLGRAGWAVSTYGLLIAPEAFRDAAQLAESDFAEAELRLQEGWLDPEAQATVCSIVPYVYPPEQREVALRRQALLERASKRSQEGLYEEAVLLLYSQLDGIFQDSADHYGEEGLRRLFSKKGVGQKGTEFRELVSSSETMSGTEEDFFLVVRDLLIADVSQTTLDDHPSRHGVLHGRVLGFGNARRVAQGFAFLVACLELLVSVQDEDRLMMTREEAFDLPIAEAPTGLRFILFAKIAVPVRGVYLRNRDGQDVLFADDSDGDAGSAP